MSTGVWKSRGLMKLPQPVGQWTELLIKGAAWVTVAHHLCKCESLHGMFVISMSKNNLWPQNDPKYSTQIRKYR